MVLNAFTIGEHSWMTGSGSLMRVMRCVLRLPGLGGGDAVLRSSVGDAEVPVESVVPSPSLLRESQGGCRLPGGPGWLVPPRLHS